MSRFATLEKACGGALNPETLAEFEQAMAEYNVFMAGMRHLFGIPNPDEQTKTWQDSARRIIPNPLAE